MAATEPTCRSMYVPFYASDAPVIRCSLPPDHADLLHSTVFMGAAIQWQADAAVVGREEMVLALHAVVEAMRGVGHDELCDALIPDYDQPCDCWKSDLARVVAKQIDKYGLEGSMIRALYPEEAAMLLDALRDPS